MIVPPPDWKRQIGVHVLTLDAPGGGARIRYFERLPVAPFRRIVDEVLAHDPAFAVRAMAGASRIVTDEGEYGAWIEVAGARDGAAAHRCIGAVITDDFVAALDGLCLRDELRATVAHLTQEMLYRSSLGLGVRRRRFLYRGPAGWQAVPNGPVATWYPPDYPGHRAHLVVFAAEPSRGAAAPVFDELLDDEEQRGFVRGPGLAQTPIAAGGGLTGVHFGISGTWPSDPIFVARDAVVFVDDRYRYVLRLESAAPERLEEDRAILRAVATSVQPLPHHGGGPPRDERWLMRVTGPWAE